MCCPSKEVRERILINSGDIINSLGLLRLLALNNNILKKEQFIEAIKKNYLIEDIPNDIQIRINNVWNNSISLFRDMGRLEKGDSESITLSKILIFPK